MLSSSASLLLSSSYLFILLYMYRWPCKLIRVYLCVNHINTHTHINNDAPRLRWKSPLMIRYWIPFINIVIITIMWLCEIWIMYLINHILLIKWDLLFAVVDALRFAFSHSHSLSFTFVSPAGRIETFRPERKAIYPSFWNSRGVCICIFTWTRNQRILIIIIIIMA